MQDRATLSAKQWVLDSGLLLGHGTDDESSYDPSDDASDKFHYGDEYCGNYSSGDEYVDDCAEGFSGGD